MNRRAPGPAALFMTASLFAFAAPSWAQSLSVSFTGSIFNCSDSSYNQSVSASFTLTGQSSGSDTIITVDLGGGMGSFPVTVPTADIQQLTQALLDAGGAQTISFGPVPVDPANLPGCDLQGTLKFSLGDSVNMQAMQATTGAVVDGFLRSTLPSISSRIRSVLRGEGTGVLTSANGLTVSGMAAGSGNRPAMGAWAGYSYTDTKNDYTPTAFTSDSNTVLFGVDTMPSANLLLGVSFSLEKNDVNTRFNNGDQDITAYTVAPYLGLLLNDWLTVDGTVGVGYVENDTSRTAGTLTVTGDHDATRIFANINGTATWSIDRLLLSGTAGMLYATQDDNDFTESDGTVNADSRYTVGRFLLGGELAYAAGAWEPYTSATFGYDYTRTDVLQGKNDDTDILVTAGLRYFGDDDLAATLEYNNLLDRRNLSEWNINASVRWSF